MIKRWRTFARRCTQTWDGTSREKRSFQQDRGKIWWWKGWISNTQSGSQRGRQKGQTGKLVTLFQPPHSICEIHKDLLVSVAQKEQQQLGRSEFSSLIFYSEQLAFLTKAQCHYRQCRLFKSLCRTLLYTSKKLNCQAWIHSKPATSRPLSVLH